MTSLDDVLERFALDEGVRSELRAALGARDQEIADRLREAAAKQGLAPSITQLVMYQVGLGESPTEAELDLIVRQAAAEGEQIEQGHALLHMAFDALRREQEGG